MFFLFRLRKGQYDVGVNTGECKNVSSVSFRKRESQEELTDDLSLSPSLKHKKLSPHSKRPHRSHSDAVSPEKLKIKTNTHVNLKHTYTGDLTSPDLNNSMKTSRTIDLSNDLKRSSSFKYETVKANEYSMIQFEHDLKTRKPLRLENEDAIKNECIPVDDSAVDLDDDICEPGYESLNDVKQRIENKNFKTNEMSAKTTDGSNNKVTKTQQFDDANQVSKALMDDSALSLSVTEPNLNSSIIDQLTSSSKSRDSGFESSKTQSSPENLIDATVIVKTETEPYDDDDEELKLDPGYAECADAIKGTLPCYAYSDGSGSKLSSCQSLDAVVDDDLEPDYAECADALKSGSVRMKISVSNERLSAQDKFAKTKSNEHIKTSFGQELYANPQILFRKRSRALNERSSGEFSNRSSETDRNESFTFSSSESLQRDLKDEHNSSQAPPLPARNYSLYLENEEASRLLECNNSIPKSLDDTNNTSQETNIKELNSVDDSPFEDFGYASVQETKNSVGKNSTNIVENTVGCFSVSDEKFHNEHQLDKNNFVFSIKNTKMNEYCDVEDFGYASVKDTAVAKNNEIDTQMQMKEGCEIELSDNMDIDSFGYASVEETKREVQCSLQATNEYSDTKNHWSNEEFSYTCEKDTKSKGTPDLSETNSKIPSDQSHKTKETDLRNSEQFQSINKGCTTLKDEKLKDRNSFELEKMKYVRTLEDEFGYTSVTNVKRQSKEVVEKENCENSNKSNEKGASSVQNKNNGMSEFEGDFCSQSLKNIDKNDASEVNVKSIGDNLKLDLTLETLEKSKAESFEVGGEKVDKNYTTSPISEVVGSGFLSSTPASKEYGEKQSVPIRTSRTFEEDRLEVTIHDRGGSCRVLKITEKEEPVALVIKRKSLRESQNYSGRYMFLDADKMKVNKHRLTVDSSTSEQEMKHELAEAVEKEEQKTVLNTDSDTSLQNLCSDKMQLDQSKTIPFTLNIDASAKDNLEDQSKNVLGIGDVDKDVQGNSLSVSAIVSASDQTNVHQEPRQSGTDSIKLPVRTNIQKVSYRSVTDSDESDDSDLKLENLPKLEIDESVFDDSDSGENMSFLDKSKSELTEAIADLTQKIEEQLNTSEETAEPIFMTLEEVMREKGTGNYVASSNGGSGNAHETPDLVRNMLLVEEEALTERSSCNQSTDVGKEPFKEITDTSCCSSFNENDVRTKVEEDSENKRAKVESDFECLDTSLRSSNRYLEQPDFDGLEERGASGLCHQDNVIAPPRPPPPVVHGEEKMAVPSGDQMQNISDDGPDQMSPDNEQNEENLPLMFRPGSGSSQSDVQDSDSPPAVPPRARIRKHVRQG